MNKKKENSGEGVKKREVGRPSNHTDKELKIMALEVKKKLRGKKLTFSILEKETGIGRNTWSRRLSKIIAELNEPIHRNIGIGETDEVYFPNINELFELYGKDKNRIITEIEIYEQNYYKIYVELQKTKQQSNKVNYYEQKVNELEMLVASLKEQVLIYEHLYKSTVIKSHFPHLHSDTTTGVMANILDFKQNRDGRLDNLDELFPTEEELKELANKKSENEIGSKNKNKLAKLFPNLLKE